MHVAIARQSFTLPLPVGQNRETGGNRSGAECAQAALHSGARDGQRGEPVALRRRGGPPHKVERWRGEAGLGGAPQPDDDDSRQRGRAATPPGTAATAGGAAGPAWEGRRAAAGRALVVQRHGAPRSPQPVGTGEGAGGVDGGTLPDALAGTTRTAVLAADSGDDRRGESLCCWLTTTAARIRGIRDAS